MSKKNNIYYDGELTIDTMMRNRTYMLYRERTHKTASTYITYTLTQLCDPLNGAWQYLSWPFLYPESP